MTLSWAGMPLNPFEDDVVREPREVLFSVKGLNDGPLSSLVARFATLDGDPLPRAPVKAPKAQLVISPDRGYGKSHLLGRLFTTLGRRATKVYLRPFQDPYRVWHSILLLTIQELERPDEGEAGRAAHAVTSTQLRAMAQGTLAHLAADLIAAAGIPDSPEGPEAVVFLLRKVGVDPALPQAPLRRWTEWLARQIADARLLGRLALTLRHRGIQLHGHEKAWLKVLAVLALDEPDAERHAAAMRWLRAEPLEPAQIELLRLAAADSEGRGDPEPYEINDLAFRRLQGLCQLASYYRPFLFCVDQTEFYASDRTLVRTLGNCLDQLYVDLANHLTVVTANQENWLREIAPHMSPPQQQRLSPEIRLEGIRKEGAHELVRKRLQEYGAEPPDVERFFGGGWLESLFSTLSELSVRALLERAAQRFRELVDPGRGTATRTLADLFQSEVNGVRARKALHAYHQDSLMWFAKDIGRGLAGVSVERLPKRRYFCVEWSLSDRWVCFAFEGGDHWSRWRSIADEVLRLSRERSARPVFSYVFRTPDLPKIPSPSWIAARSSLDAASEHGFTILELTLDEVCELHAARELYSNALQGNLAYSGDETLAWLQGHFAQFVKSLAYRQRSAGEAAERAQHPGPAVHARSKRDGVHRIGLDDEKLRIVVDMVREQRIIDIAAVLARLGGEQLRDSLLRSVETHPNLKAHPGPRTIFLQWRTTPYRQASLSTP
jgi:hypothetical protein